jgi:hypothetical protein
MPVPSLTRPQAVPFARWPEPRRAARFQKWKLQERKLDGRGHQGAKVAADSRPDLCQERDYRMTLKPSNMPSPAAGQPGRPPPVRVKLLRPDAYAAQTHPPDGASKDWWQRLNKALGTTSSDFVNASLLQLQAAARSPFGTVSETHINAALAMIEAAAPKDEIEGALAVPSRSESGCGLSSRPLPRAGLPNDA